MDLNSNYKFIQINFTVTSPIPDPAPLNMIPYSRGISIELTNQHP
jgi:hypothetical protein